MAPRRQWLPGCFCGMLAIWVQGLYNGIKKKGGVEMKKWLAVFLCMAALTLVGCAEQVVQPEESTSRPVETTVPVVTEGIASRTVAS